MISCIGAGRLGNKIFRNLYGYFVCKENDFKMIVDDQINMINLGLDFKKHSIMLNSIDKNKYNIILLSDNNIDNYLENINNFTKDDIYILEGYCQTEYFSKYLFDYFSNKENFLVQTIIQNNKYKERYNNNNDLIIHVRQGDVMNTNKVPNEEYYDKAISYCNYNNGYIISDTINSRICRYLIQKYDLKILNQNQIDELLFASTCNNIILSCGTYSYCIGLFAFYTSKIIYCDQKHLKQWHGKIFESTNWIYI
jgi:hypothetical protein